MWQRREEEKDWTLMLRPIVTDRTLPVAKQRLGELSRNDRTLAGLRPAVIKLMRLVTRPRPLTLYCHLTGCTGPTEASVRSLTVTPSRLCFFTELIHFNSNFFSFANMPTPLSVHHHVYVC